MDTRALLAIFHEPGVVEFNWKDTHFPEPGLSAALRTTHPNLYRNLKPGDAKTHAQVLFEVSMARRIMYHYCVPDDDVADRMEEMGMGLHWRALTANNISPPGLDLVPRRDPNDLAPFMWPSPYSRASG